MLLFAAIAEDSIRHREAAIDDSLLIGVAQGDKQAFTQLYRMAGRSIYAYALSILKNPTEAEDALQDTFLKIRAAAPLYKPMGSSDNRAMIFSTAQLTPKTTRNTIGVAVMSLKKKAVLTGVIPLEKSEIVNAGRYMNKNIPSAGAILKEEDSVEKQISFDM